MSIASEITALNNNLEAAKAAIEAAGGTVGDTGLAGLSTEIASIPAGEPDVPVGDYGKVEFYKYMTLTDIEENYGDCSVEIVDIRKLASKYVYRDDDGIILNYLGSDDWSFLNGDYEEENYTTEELLSIFGLSVTDISSGEAYIRIWGNISVDKFSGKQCYSIDTLEDFNKFCFHSSDEITIGGDVHNKNQIAMFIIGSAVTAIPAYFLRSCENLADLDTTLTTNVTSIEDYALSSLKMPNTTLHFPNVTTIGNYVFSYTTVNAFDLPNVVSIGKNFMDSSGNSFPSLPKVQTIGDHCYYGGKGGSIMLPTTLKTLGNYAFSNSKVENVTIYASSQLESIGSNFFSRCSILNFITVGKDITGCFDQSDNSAFMASTGYLSYMGGLKCDGLGANSLKTRFPDTVSGSSGRKWRAN